jgi:hypothetical protein
MITPMPSGSSSDCAADFKLIAVGGAGFLREMPPPRGVFGMRTQ